MFMRTAQLQNPFSTPTMPRTQTRMWNWFIGVALATTVGNASSFAQSTTQATGSIAGIVVTDSTEIAIATAEVLFPQLKLSARTDKLGKFRISGVPFGRHEVLVRSIGYESVSSTIAISSSGELTVDFVLAVAKTTLKEIRVKERYAARLVDFDERRRFKIGRFLTSELFEEAKGQNLSQILMRNIPGVFTSGTGFQQQLVSGRGKKCAVQVIVDGLIRYNGRPNDGQFDINGLRSDDVIGVEFYTVATTPAQFNSTGGRSGGSQCGTIVIWTK
jgi:hypothetical protein